MGSIPPSPAAGPGAVDLGGDREAPAGHGEVRRGRGQRRGRSQHGGLSRGLLLGPGGTQPRWARLGEELGHLSPSPCRSLLEAALRTYILEHFQLGLRDPQRVAPGRN